MNRNKIKAFTLMELMIVVAIVGILSAIAVPMYIEQMKKGKRNDAMQALLAASEAAERYKAANFSYAGLNGNLSSVFATQVPVDGGTSYYTLAIVADTTSYTITATPVNSMAGDGTLSINSSGQKLYKGTDPWPK